MPFQEEVQIDLLFYRSAPQPDLGGEHGIPIVYPMDCCIRWPACMRSPPRGTRDLFDCISITWANVCGRVEVLALDGETGMRSREAGVSAMCSPIAFKYKAPHQTTWFVERHNALIRSAPQRAESKVSKESLCVSSVTIPCL